MESKIIHIEVVYIESCGTQWIIPLKLPEKVTVLQVIEAAGILKSCPEIDLQAQKVGIFGTLTCLTAEVKDNDRVEIYRPLPIDPIARRFEQVKKERKHD